MSTEYSRAVLRVCVAKCCNALGWQSIHASSLEILTDILERYIMQIAQKTHAYSEQFGRSDPTVDDVGLAFADMNISIAELMDYVKHVDPMPCSEEASTSFPAPASNQLNIPAQLGLPVPKSREDHIPDYMPLMTHEWEEIQNTIKPSPSPVAPTADATPAAPSLVDRPPLLDGQPPPKKIRLLPDEARHSQYEMKSVAMSNGGFVSPLRGAGKLPDARTPPSLVIASRNSAADSASSTALAGTAEITPKVSKMDTSVKSGTATPTKTSKVNGRGESEKKPSLDVDYSPEISSMDLVTCGTAPIKSPSSSSKSKRSSKSKSKSSKSKSKISSFKDKSGKVKAASKLKSKALKKTPKKKSSSSVLKSPTHKERSPVKVGLEGLPITEVVHIGTEPIHQEHKSPAATDPVAEQVNVSVFPKSPGNVSIPALPDTPSVPKPIHSSTPNIDHLPSKKSSKKQKLRKSKKKHSSKKSKNVSKLPIILDESLETEKITNIPLPVLAIKDEYDVVPDPRHERSPTRSRSASPVVKMESPVTSPPPSPPSPLEAISPEECKEDVSTPALLHANEHKLSSKDVMFDDTDDSDNNDTMSYEKVSSWVKTENAKTSDGDDDQKKMDSTLQDMAKTVLSTGFGGDTSLESDDDTFGGFTIDKSNADTSRLPPKKRAIKKASKPKRSSKKSGKKKSSDITIVGDPPSIADSTLTSDSLNKNFVFPDVSYIKHEVDAQSVSGRSTKEKSISPAPSTGDDAMVVKPLKITIGKDSSQTTVPPRKDKKKKKSKDRDRETSKDRTRDRRERSKDKKSKQKDKKDRSSKREKPVDTLSTCSSSSIPKVTIKLGANTSTSTVTKPDIPRVTIIKGMDGISSAHSTPVPTPTVLELAVDSPRYSLSSSLASTSPASSPQQDPEDPPLSLMPAAVDERPVSRSSRSYSRETTPLSVRHRRSPTISPPRPAATSSRSSRRSSKRAASTTKHTADTKSSTAAKANPKAQLPELDSKGVSSETTERAGTFVDDSGQIIWICPACKMPDDGTPMIGCDKCDDWYHWTCVGIKVEPAENSSWFCKPCIKKMKEEGSLMKEMGAKDTPLKETPMKETPMKKSAKGKSRRKKR